MLTIHNQGMYYKNGSFIPARDGAAAGLPAPEQAKQGTMAYAILKAHNTGEDMDNLAIRFDAMASHDITYVGIIQTARASGMTEFPLPYVLTNCHNSLCAVGGTINEDDHVFGLSAAKKYGGEFVPAHQSVIHSYMRERYAAPGKMILGSDSHTRYGAYGTMAIGEGGPELARQLLKKTYNIAYPRVIAIYLTGAPIPGVGPQDVALELIRSTFKDGTVKNAVMEFFGPGVANLSMDYRSGIDVMTTETTCLSSVWQTDTNTQTALTLLGRGAEYHPIQPKEGAAELLEELKKRGVPMTIATATDRYLVEGGLRRLNMDKYFEGIFTCSEVGVGKRDGADVYEAALRLMGARKAKSWVFEDSPHAARTAAAAGFNVAGVKDIGGGNDQDELKKYCKVYFESLLPTERVLENICKI